MFLWYPLSHSNKKYNCSSMFFSLGNMFIGWHWLVMCTCILFCLIEMLLMAAVFSPFCKYDDGLQRCWCGSCHSTKQCHVIDVRDSCKSYISCIQWSLPIHRVRHIRNRSRHINTWYNIYIWCGKFCWVATCTGWRGWKFSGFSEITGPDSVEFQPIRSYSRFVKLGR